MAGLAALLLLVGLASRPDGINQVLVGARVGRLVVDTAFYLLLVLLPLGLAGFIWLLHTRPDEAPLRLERQRRHWLLPILSGLALVVILWLRPGGQVNLSGLLGGGGTGLFGGSAGMALGSQQAGGFDWAAGLLAATVIAVCAYLAWRALRAPAAAAPRATKAVSQALSDALQLSDEGAGNGDARATVIRAWITVEAVFRAHGVPREPSEAPFEYARRAPPRLGVAAAPLERLAELYEWARFSTHEVSDDMRVRALTGLRSIRDEVVSATI